MKKIVLICGSISGLIVTAMMVISVGMCYDDPNFQGNMLLGYASMLLAFSLVFIGIKNFRDKQNNGVITFGKGFKIGLYISLIASTMYVLTWLVEYYAFIPDFMEKYSAHMLNEAKTSGASQVEIDATIAEMAKYSELYKNPLFVILLTYMEVLPIGILVTLISAAILRKKDTGNTMAVN